MTTFKPGLVHTPVTPFKADHSIDYETYAKLIEFHLHNGAEAIATPMPAGEDMSLKDDEQGVLLEFVLKQVKGRVPVIAHVSDAGTSIAIERAKYAEKLGVAAIVSHPPYFWHPQASMVVEHLVQIGNATQLPYFLCSPPVEDVGTPLTVEITIDVIDRVPTLQGVVDATMDFVIMVETISLGAAKRPGFQLIPGTDYMVTAGAIGAMGVFSPLAAVAPKLVRQVYDLCTQQKFTEARAGQEDLAELAYCLKLAGLAGLKAALHALGRDCGRPRPPARALNVAEQSKLATDLQNMKFVQAEPRGW